MKTIKILVITLTSFFALQGCMVDNQEKQAGAETAASEANAEPQKTILVYGSDECSHCVDFKAQLDSAGLEYTFYDVEKDQSKGEEMMLKVQRTGFQGYVRFPVVEVDGKIVVAPRFETVESAL
jgi:glutaredoxin